MLLTLLTHTNIISALAFKHVSVCSTVLEEAARLKKHNLFTDTRDLLSQSSCSSLFSTPFIPSNPARMLGFHGQLQTQPETPTFIQTHPETQPEAEVTAQPASPLQGNGLVVGGGAQG